MPILRRLSIILSLFLVPACSNSVPIEDLDVPDVEAFHDLQARRLDGSELSFDEYVDKPILVVNTASKCGKTPQYAGLQDLHEEFGPEGLVVLGFPSNQFFGQEPGDAEEIAAFCEANYGVTFTMMEKVEVKAGESQSPVYAFLAARTGKVPDWNFAKYLVSADGREVRYFGSSVGPGSAELRAAVEAALAR